MSTTILSEREKLAAWLEIVATIADDGRKKDRFDKRRIAAKYLRDDEKLIQKLRAENERLRTIMGSECPSRPGCKCECTGKLHAAISDSRDRNERLRKELEGK